MGGVVVGAGVDTGNEDAGGTDECVCEGGALKEDDTSADGLLSAWSSRFRAMVSVTIKTADRITIKNRSVVAFKSAPPFA